MREFVLVAVFAPAASFLGNLALCKLFPSCGNYVTVCMAIAGGIVATKVLSAKCMSHASNQRDNKSPIVKGVSYSLGAFFGCTVAAIIGFPVAIKIVIAIIAKVMNTLVAYSDT